jgi:hypothetical protein
MFSGGLASGEPMPLNQEEVYAFLWELAAANQRCDAEWLEQEAYLPTTTLTFAIEGGPTVTVKRDEYLQGFRRECFHTRQSFDTSSISVEVGGNRAVVSGRWEHGAISRFFFFTELELEWIEETQELIRHGEGIKVQEVRQVLMPVPGQFEEAPVVR